MLESVTLMVVPVLTVIPRLCFGSNFERNVKKARKWCARFYTKLRIMKFSEFSLLLSFPREMRPVLFGTDI